MTGRLYAGPRPIGFTLLTLFVTFLFLRDFRICCPKISTTSWMAFEIGVWCFGFNFDFCPKSIGCKVQPRGPWPGVVPWGGGQRGQELPFTVSKKEK